MLKLISEYKKLNQSDRLYVLTILTLASAAVLGSTLALLYTIIITLPSWFV